MNFFLFVQFYVIFPPYVYFLKDNLKKKYLKPFYMKSSLKILLIISKTAKYVLNIYHVPDLMLYMNYLTQPHT